MTTVVSPKVESLMETLLNVLGLPSELILDMLKSKTTLIGTPTSITSLLPTTEVCSFIPSPTSSNPTKNECRKPIFTLNLGISICIGFCPPENVQVLMVLFFKVTLIWLMNTIGKLEDQLNLLLISEKMLDLNSFFLIKMRLSGGVISGEILLVVIFFQAPGEGMSFISSFLYQSLSTKNMWFWLTRH